MRDGSLDDVREHRDGELFPGFASIPLYHGPSAAVGWSRARWDSPLWSAPLPNPERGVIFAFPRRPYWVRAGERRLAVTPHGMRVLASGDDVPRACPDGGFDIENAWIQVTSDRLVEDLHRAGIDPEAARTLASRASDVPLAAETHALLRALIAYLEHEPERDAGVVERAISEVVVRAMAGEQERGAPAREVTWRGHVAAVHRTRMFLAQNYANPVALGHVAQAAGLSRSHLCRVFRALTGQSVHAFRNELRLREALWRLPDYRHRVGELGVELGFCSPSHFTTAFRSCFGAPPASYDVRSRLCGS
ncbi:MAG: helix-turn-helix transcriptional regulator [Gemmatimonadetes bacterium]|nr:helix-turn-helix transcriptional regulator [Gemmatimonadota bacterium]